MGERVTDNADTIHPTETSTFSEWCAAYDALLAERRQAIDALQQVYDRAPNLGDVTDLVRATLEQLVKP